MPNRRSVLRKNCSEQKPWEDEILREVYAQREAFSAEHGHDVRKLYDAIRQSAPTKRRRSPRSSK